MFEEKAECNQLPRLLNQIGEALAQYQRFEHGDAMQRHHEWHDALQQKLPDTGIGIDNLLSEITRYLILNGSVIPKAGCTSFITTGATTAGVLATLAGAVASPQRIGLTAFNHLEELSLNWLAELFSLPADMKGVYSSGGSVANLVALGAARQWAYEQLNIDPAHEGISKPAHLYVTHATHHTVQRAAAALGLGRRAAIVIESDNQGRMIPQSLREAISRDRQQGIVPVAVVATAGTTSTGVIDPLLQLGQIARQNRVWFHVDGAYGLPGILDPRVQHLYAGLELADSVIVDPHKWLGAPVGIGATFVRDRALLHRAFTQEASDYLEGSLSSTDAKHSLDTLGIPYHDFGVELSAPARGAVVWSLIREIGKEGLRDRVCRHNEMARQIAERVKQHPNLELALDPVLSICCFRYVNATHNNLNALNRDIHRRLVHNNRNIPSTAIVKQQFYLRPCFVGARTSYEHANDLVNEVLEIGNQLTSNDY